MDLWYLGEVGLEHGVHSNCNGAGFALKTGKGDKSWGVFVISIPPKVFAR